MASYQQDYKKNDIAALIAAYNYWYGSKDRLDMVIGKDYYNGDNTTIRNVRRLYFSQGKKTTYRDVETGQEVETKINGGWIENPFVSNFKIPYGIFHDTVAQKVNTLLNETPILEGEEAKKIDKDFLRNFGYALKKAGINASAQGYAYIFVGADGVLQVFETENCLPFFDDETGALKALYRFWTIEDMQNNKHTYAEEYNTDGIIRYSFDDKISTATQTKKVNYSYKIYSDITGKREEAQNLGILPIVIVKNDEKGLSDLRPNLRAKIDAIDIVTSGLANNIEDFADVYWTIKASTEVDAEVLEDFCASISRTKKVLSQGEGADATPHQFEIPVNARDTFVEKRKVEIVQETGVIDTASMTGSSLTTTAIKAATMKLRQRVADFEWEVYQSARAILSIYGAYQDIDVTDIEIEFVKMLIQNDTELIDNAVKVRGDISKESYLGLLQKAGVIDNVQSELERLEEENASSYKIVDPELDGLLQQTMVTGDGDNGQGAQSNGPDAGQTGEATE